MFKDPIYSTPFYNEQVNEIFGGISGGIYCADVSFCSTLRALVYPRIGDGKIFATIYNETGYTSTQIKRMIFDEKDYFGCTTDNIRIISLSGGNSDERPELIESVDKTVKEEFEGFEELPKIREFYRKSFEVRCYINRENKNVFIIVDSLDYKKLHYLQVSILAFLPWYFNPAVDTLSEEEKNLIYSLNKPSEAPYLECLEVIAHKYNVRELRIEKILKGCESVFNKAELGRVENEIRSTNERMEYLMDQYSDLLCNLRNLQIRQMGILESVNKTEENKIMDFFLKNKNLYVLNFEESVMRFALREYITFFDIDLFDKMINRPEDEIFYGIRFNHKITKDDMIVFLKAGFSEEPKYKIRTCAAFSLDIMGGRCRPMRDYAFKNASGFTNCLPNPHLNTYQCLGGNEMAIVNAIKNHEFIGAITQCQAACKNLNWGDYTVVEKFINDLLSTDLECVEFEDGTCRTVIDSIKFLKSQETL